MPVATPTSFSSAACSGCTFGRPSSSRTSSASILPSSITFGIAGRDAPRDLARDRADLALELAHAASRVYLLIIAATASSVNDDVLVAEARLLELPRNQVLLGDLRLFALRVARELDDFHAVEERTGNVLDEVRGRDEQHFAQVERNAEVVIGEGVVLRRIEHLEQRARRIALERHAELVDFVEQEDRDSSCRPASCPG